MKTGLFRLLGVVILVASFGGGWLWIDIQQFIETPILLKGDLIVVERGASLRQIAQQLEQQGIVRSGRYLDYLGRYHGLATQLKAGEYPLQGAMTPLELLQQLVSGRERQYSFTMIEGWTVRDLLAALRREPLLQQTIAADMTPEHLLAALDLPTGHAEGEFLPDTYYYTRNSSDRELLIRAYRAMQQQVLALWSQRALHLPLATPYEAQILASIIEKETALVSERPQIAGVFVRRLQQSMRLQTDPTVIYGIGPLFDGNLTRKQLQSDTPYNSYLRYGLPPTPIALPGEAALRAALQPAAGSSLYFVARGDGSHQFSATLAEHNEAVKRYQLRH